MKAQKKTFVLTCLVLPAGAFAGYLAITGGVPLGKNLAKPGTAAYYKATKPVELFNKALKERKQGNDPIAVSLLEQSLRIRRIEMSINELAEIYLETNNRSKAFEMYSQLFHHPSRAVSSYDHDPIPNYQYAELCFERGLDEEGQAAYDRILERTPYQLTVRHNQKGGLDDNSMLFLHVIVGDAYAGRSLRDKTLAREEYLKALALKPSNTEARWTLAWKFPGSKTAIALLNQIVAKNDVPRLTKEAAQLIGEWDLDRPTERIGTSRPKNAVLVPLSEKDRKEMENHARELQRIGQERGPGGIVGRVARPR